MQDHALVVRYSDATEQDADSIAALHAESWRRHYRGAYLDTYLDGDIITERQEVWRGRLREPRTGQLTVIARRGDGLVGFAHTILDDRQWGSLLENLHVTSELKRSGIGSRLLSKPPKDFFRLSPPARCTSGYLIRTQQLRLSTTLGAVTGSRLSFAGRFPAVADRSVIATTGRIQAVLL